LKLSARQWWVFVFIGSADTLYLEKGANTAIDGVYQPKSG